MKTAAIFLFKLVVKLFYALACLRPQRENRILFLSRQESQLPLDFKLIQEELEDSGEDLDIQSICYRFAGKSDGVLGFMGASIRSIGQIARAKVVVLDGYWPVLSVLKLREGTKVVQIWHSVGKIKKSGYQSLDTDYGRSAKLAKQLCMHRNYDYIITGGHAWDPYYCEAFDVEEDKLRNFGLPRLDYLVEKAGEYSKEVLKAYPEFEKKKVVLYAPTFRTNEELKWQELAEGFLKYKDQVCFLCKFHPRQIGQVDMEGVYTCPDFPTMELLPVSDVVITDYSSLCLEAAALNKRIYYYIYDVDEYMAKNGINLDMRDCMPKASYQEPGPLFQAVMNDEYDEKELEEFRSNYLPDRFGSSAGNVATLILEVKDGREY